MTKRIRVGTRGSRLALIQTQTVIDRLAIALPDLQFEVRVMKTQGDKFPQSPFSRFADAGLGLFTREIEQALAAGEIDLAVHSAKDMPTQLHPGLSIIAVPEREDAREAWVSAERVPLRELPCGAAVGTSSTRRKAELLHLRPDLETRELRGNVPTRLRKMRENGLGGILLAYGGLIRLGLDKEVTEILPEDVFLPAAGQGAIAVEAREGNVLVREFGSVLTHETSRARVMAERSLLEELGGGCQVPIGVSSRVQGESLNIKAAVFSLDGSKRIEADMTGHTHEAAALGTRLGRLLMDRGGREILQAILGRAGEKP